MTSYILSEEIDVRDYGFIYAGAQKNAGISGITIGIIRRDLLERLAHTSHVVPTLFKYETYVNEQSCYNTPPTFAWYVTLRMLEWVKEQGGPKTFAMQHARQSEWLYSLIDSSDFYQSAVSEPYRSKMNIAFRLPDAKLEPIFLDLAEQNDLLALKGHRSVGGLRASLYNAMPDEGVKSLVDFMKTFEKTHG